MVKLGLGAVPRCGLRLDDNGVLGTQGLWAIGGPSAGAMRERSDHGSGRLRQSAGVSRGAARGIVVLDVPQEGRHLMAGGCTDRRSR